MKYTPVTSGSLDLTDGTLSDNGPGYKASRSAFYNTPLPVNTSFNATFTYTASDPGGAGGYGANYDNGFAFVIQNSVSGAQAVAGAARGIGVGNDPETSANNIPIGHSAEIAYDFFPYYGNPNSATFSVAPSVLGPGTGFNTNGGTGNSNGIPDTPLPVFGGSSNTYHGSLDNIPGDPVNMTVSYNALTHVLSWSGTDVSSGAFAGLTFSETQAGVNLQTITGSSMAYIGFTGGDGEFGSTQTISNFSFSGLAASTNVLPSTTPLFIASGGSVDLFGGNQTVGDLSGAGVVTNSYSNSIGTLTVGTDGTSQTFSGTLQDGAGTLTALTKVGSGTQTLTGANAYTGATTISGGALAAIDGIGLPSTSNLVFSGSLAANGYGAVLASSGTFTRPLGTGAGQVQWTGDGGFSAVGGPLTVAINNNHSDPLGWGTTNFVGTGHVLTFGSPTANNQVDFTDSINLTGGSRRDRRGGRRRRR